MSDTQVDADSTAYTVLFEDDAATDTSFTGGKGANLARLIEADLPVPSGFCVTTAAYRAVIDDSDIQTAIRLLETLDPADTETIAEASAEIRSKIRQRELPDAVQHAVVDALNWFTADAYSVRSSATAEDLPTASFAGQHETFLGITEQAAVLDRIRDCMASLFTDRAVSYRSRNDISHTEVDMAVVVQAMVDPEVAGVLFTADPVSGNRHIASIDANFGLGDTVVAGEVSPDNVRIDRRTGEILEYDVGNKGHALRSEAADAGGTETVELPPEKRESRALSDTQLRTLLSLGDQIEELLGDPQDIEWALVNGEFVLLQARPITSLYPLPSPLPDDEYLHVYYSFGHQQAMPEALPPLVVDFLREFVTGVATRVRPAASTEPLGVEAGHRVYIDLTPLLRIDLLRQKLPAGLDAMSEPAANALRQVLDQRVEAIPPRERVDGVLTIARSIGCAAPIVVSVVPRIVARFTRSFVLGPPNLDDERVWCETWGKRLATRVRQPTSRPKRVRIAFEQFDLGTLLTEALPHMASLPAGVAAKKFLVRMFPDADDDIEALGKGFEKEIVTQINQQVGDLADIARRHPNVAQALRDEASMAEIEQVDGGDEFVDAFEEFRDEFGHRASNEIDLSRPRWRDNPGTVMGTIRSNLVQGNPGAHRDHLHRLERDAQEAAARLETRAGRGVFGRVKKPVVRRLIQTYRGGIQLREYPKQGMAHLLAAAHDEFTDVGESLAADGRLSQPDDVWYLRKDELLAALEEDAPVDADIETRRRTFERHTSLTAPPILTSEGEAPTATGDTESSEGMLTGTPVSAGVVDGPARVVRDPTGESLENGEILIAPSTDPGWTPLFLNAEGLVMGVGGRMTHGALVAREYGIPAVVSVSDATTEIQTGERIRIDGRRGTVEFLDRSDESASADDLDTSTTDGT